MNADNLQNMVSGINTPPVKKSGPEIPATGSIITQVIRMNGEIALHLQLPGIETKVEIFGEIKRMTRDPKKINLGLLFHDVDNITVDRITEYIHTVEKFNPGYDQP